VIFKEEDDDGRERVTEEEERVSIRVRFLRARMGSGHGVPNLIFVVGGHAQRQFPVPIGLYFYIACIGLLVYQCTSCDICMKSFYRSNRQTIRGVLHDDSLRGALHFRWS